ncbi:MAG: hypothetical protein WAK55_18950 [Xanthobacteraceae bacterium]
MSSRFPIRSVEGRQLRTVWGAADRVPVEKRGTFLERVVARLQRTRGFTDVDLDDAMRAALTGLIQSAAS